MLIEKMEEILIKTKRDIFGTSIGSNSSIFMGSGMNFSKIREYHAGDDVRRINWKVTARSGKPHINIFEDERELNIVIVFMVSGSIYFGSHRFKQEVMSEVLALLSYSSFKNNDRVTTIFFSDKEEFFHKPTRNIGSLNITLEYALSQNPLGKEVKFKKVVNHLQSFLHRKSMLFLVGDFYGKIDLSSLANHEIYSIIVRDRFEESPVFNGDMSLIDPNSMVEDEFMLNRYLLDEYKKELIKNDNRLYQHLLENRVTYTKIYTDQEPNMKLQALFRG